MCFLSCRFFHVLLRHTRISPCFLTLKQHPTEINKFCLMNNPDYTLEKSYSCIVPSRTNTHCLRVFQIYLFDIYLCRLELSKLNFYWTSLVYLLKIFLNLVLVSIIANIFVHFQVHFIALRVIPFLHPVSLIRMLVLYIAATLWPIA